MGCTEVVWDSLNPKFTHKFILVNDFIEIEDLILEVQDTEANECTNGIPQINSTRLIGSSVISFNSVVRSYGKKVGLEIMKNKTKSGIIKV